MKNKLNILSVALLLTAATLLSQESKLENPLPGKPANAAFENAEEGPPKVRVSTNDGKSFLDQQLRKQTIENAKWTNDGNYLVMIGRNSDGHSPWRCIVAVFSVADREVRLIDDSEGHPPCIGREIWCQEPDTVILIGHTFAHQIAAPDDPILLKYEMSKLWPSLRKL